MCKYMVKFKIRVKSTDQIWNSPNGQETNTDEDSEVYDF